jgi:tetratricopeptide (TPR) repeat protein
MDVLKQQVGRAQRRLALQRFIAVLSWCWFGALLVAAVLIAVDKYYPLGVLPWGWVAGGLGVGLAAAMVWTWLTRRSQLEAALEIDRRFGLKERVSSTFALGADQLDSPAGKALIEDALKRVDRLHVAEKFRVKLNRWTWLPLAPAALAFLLAMYLNPSAGENKAGGSIASKAERKAVKTSTEALRKKLIERRKEAREQGLKDAEELFAKLEQGTKQLAKADLADRKQAMVELNDLAKDLEKRRQKLGGGDKLQDQLKQLKNIQQGPADKLAEAMRQGDFQQALKELKELRDQIEHGKLDAEAKAQLGKQLEEMEKKLRQVADAHKKLEQDLKQQAKELRKKGQNKEADEIEKQLAKLAQKAPQMEQLQKMADKLGQCSKCMKQGDKAGAKAAMDAMKAELADLQEQADELAMLDEAMSELDMAKDSMGCKECDGMGCRACAGNNPFGRPGMGMGRGRGQGPRPEEKGDTNAYDTKANLKRGKGAAVVVGSVEGPNMKGQVEQEIQTQFEAAKAAAEDPLTDQQLPRSYREHAKKYFDGLREGKK